MSWSERQRAMLREMGIRLFEAPPGAAGPFEEAPAPGPMAEADAQRPGAGAGDDAGVLAAAPAVAAAPPSPAPSAPASPAAALPATRLRDDPAARAIAAMDWPALREAVSTCQACSLSRTRRQTVFGVGHPRAHWMIIGEAPGEQEDQRGEPFVGPAGQLLDQMLAAVGLTRSEAPPERQVFIANTLKCRPPRNRNPEPAELACCEPYLRRQLALVQPRIILAMGRFAVQSLLDSSEPIGRLRGRVHAYAGVPLVVTYHPAYLLRNPVDKARAWDDLCLAADTAAAAA